MNFALTIGKRTLRISTGRMPPTPAVREPAAPQGREAARMFAAAQANRLTAAFPITITSADAEIMVSALGMRSRLRNLERDDDYFRHMLLLIENNVIGSGIRLRMKVRDKAGKLDKAFNESVQEAWLDYLAEENCTVTRNINGSEVQRLTMRCLARDGAILFRKHHGFDNPYRYALEPIEIDRLDHWYNRPANGSNNEIRFGIERDRFGAAVAYWILTRHPGDTFAYGTSPMYRERVPAEDIIAIWTTERAGQSIGIPLWPSVARRLMNLHLYEEAEQVAATIASAKGGWFEQTAPAGSDDYVGDGEDAQGNKLVDTAPGQWETLPLGLKPHENNPQHPTEAFPHFVKAQLRGASAGAGLPYNSTASDLEGVSYSAFKAGMNDARDCYKYLQELVTRKLMRKWFRDWFPYAVMSGKVTLPETMVQQYLKMDRWKPRRWAGLEPLKEVQAAVIAVEAGLDSRRNVIEEHFDRDIEEVFDEQEHDNELADEHKLVFSAVEKPIVGAGGGAQVDSDTSRQVPSMILRSGKQVAKETNGSGNNGHARREMPIIIPQFPKRLTIEGPASQPPPINVSVENKPAAKRKFKFVRNSDGTLVGAEMEQE